MYVLKWSTLKFLVTKVDKAVFDAVEMYRYFGYDFENAIRIWIWIWSIL